MDINLKKDKSEVKREEKYNLNSLEKMDNDDFIMVDKKKHTIKNTKDDNIETTKKSENDTEQMNINLVELEDDIQYKTKMNLYCMNCGKRGHITKKCNYPIISIGIILIYIEHFELDINTILSYSKKIQNKYLFENDEIRELKELYAKIKNMDEGTLDKNVNYLMIRRKNSLSYVDFIRGKYDLNDYEYLHNTISMMTNEEKNNLLKKNFDELWGDLWSSPTENIKKPVIFNQEYDESKNKFNKLKDGYMLQKNELLFFVNFKKIIGKSLERYEDPEWGFPKGRRNMNEKNIECAKREFQEETGMKENEYHILNFSPLEEIYLGSNHIRYKHIYYFAQTSKKKIIKLDENNIEVGSINWFPFGEGYDMIRFYHKEKKNILFNIHTFVKELIINFQQIYQTFYKKNKSQYFS